MGAHLLIRGSCQTFCVIISQLQNGNAVLRHKKRGEFYCSHIHELSVSGLLAGGEEMRIDISGLEFHQGCIKTAQRESTYFGKCPKKTTA